MSNFHIFLLGLFSSVSITISFNISPFPNITYSKPFTNGTDSEDRSTYFGFSLLLRQDSIIVGAPRSNSTLKSQSSIIEPGAIYNCYIFDKKNCEIIILESGANKDNKLLYEEQTEIRHKQWLGASISGSGTKLTNEEIPFMACAPHITTRKFHMIKGICYINRNVNENITAEKYQNDFEIGRKFLLAEKMSDFGMSSYWIESRKIFLVGIPSLTNGRGGFSIYNLDDRKKKINGDLLKRESYLGYSVTAGILDENKIISYGVSAPRYNDNGGIIIIKENNLKKRTDPLITGPHNFEYFGYSMIMIDLNNDSISEIIVSAPFYTEKNHYEIGAIYVFSNKNEYKLKEPTIMGPNKFSGGRFGSSLASLGDINLDGYNDIAVGAPYEANGIVYIFHGSSNGIIKKPKQILKAPATTNGSPLKPNYFGFSISNGIDVDGNGINDIAISAINIDKIYLFKTYPIINVDIIFENFPLYIDSDKNSIEIISCILFTSLTNQFNHNLTFELILNLDQTDQRIKFENNLSVKKAIVKIQKNENECITNLINIKHRDIIKPFKFELTYNFIQKEIDEEFCDSCAIINPNNNNLHQKDLFIKHLCRENDTCTSDLKITIISMKRNTLILDEDQSVVVSFKIENFKDPAYLPRLNITTNQILPLAQVLSTCRSVNSVLQCDLWNDENLVLKKNEIIKLNITFDIINLKGSELKINATVFSSNEESDVNNNFDSLAFNVVECSVIEIVDTSMIGSQFLNVYDNQDDIIDIVKKFEIKNSGPSTLTNLILEVQYPIILTYNNISEIQSPIKPHNEYFSNNIISTNRTVDGSTLNDNKIKIISINDNPLNIKSIIQSVSDVCISTSHHFENSYIKEIASNSTIIFNSDNIEWNKLIITDFPIDKLDVESKQPLILEIQMKFDQKYFWNLLDKHKKESMIYKMNFFIRNQTCNNDIHCTPSIVAFRTKVYDIFVKRIVSKKPPIWIYICSFILGIVVYFLIAFIFYKMGFFKRAKHEEVKDFRRQSLMRQSMRITTLPHLGEFQSYDNIEDNIQQIIIDQKTSEDEEESV